ncbi:MAG: putative Ribokinase [Candidatus Saccharibacteria bacterium]|nr:putative Ribokinase [Candidatus Saccharibacteria bacterium]
MAKFLRDLLGAQEPFFGIALQNLERASGHSGLDARLIGDILIEAHNTMRHIGLDPADTTGLELYNALKAHVNDEGLFSETAYVGLFMGGIVVSFNLADIRENLNKTYGEHTTENMKCALQRELVDRYVQHERTDEKVVAQFATDAGLHRCEGEHINVDKEETMDKPKILSIGDIFTDAFIKLREDKARIDVDPDGSKRLSMEFGSKPPYDRVDIVEGVGPSPNAAVAFSRLGLNSSLMSFLGDDLPGKNSLASLHKEGIDTSLTFVAPDMKSNYYYVLRYGADRTILVKDEDYDYKWQEPTTVPDWIYLSLISDKSWQLHEDLMTYLEVHPEVKFAFQPGTFQFDWGPEKLQRLYARAEIVVMNREEAVLVTGKSYDSIKELADGLHALGPKIAVITDGPDGAYASGEGKLIKMPNYPDPGPPVDRTGAGDAFASTIVATLALGESLETALRWAPINSMNVVQNLGAQGGLLSKEKIEAFLQDAPESYHAEDLA